MHLDGLKEHHDKAVSQKGMFDRAVSAIKAAKAKGFPSTSTPRSSTAMPPRTSPSSSTSPTELGVGVSISPGYAYERAPDQEHFLNRTKTKKLFRDVFALGKGKKWKFIHSGLFLDFLAGNQDYDCTPWGMPARNIFGWQKPCYLLGEGYTKTFKELMETTDWDTYGTGKYEKCADCMAHCGYEPTAANASLTNPLKALWVALRGVRTDGPDGAGDRSSTTSVRRSTSSRRRCRRAVGYPQDEAAAAAKAQQKASPPPDVRPTQTGACDAPRFVEARPSSSSALRAPPHEALAAEQKPRSRAGSQRAIESIPVETSAAASAGCAPRRAAPCAGRYRRSA